MLRNIEFFIISIVVSFMIVCGFSYNSYAEDQHLRIITKSEAYKLDPIHAVNEEDTQILKGIFSGLTVPDAKANIIPGLAKSWTKSKDGLIYIFKLRDNLKFSDGSTLTSEDVVFSIRRLFNPKSASVNASDYFYIKNAKEVNNGELTVDKLGVKALDKNTVQIELKLPNPLFLNHLSDASFGVVSKKALTTYGGEWTKKAYVGSGAFKLQEKIIEDHTTLVKNNQFYDADKVKLNKITFYPVMNASTAINMILTGKADILRYWDPTKKHMLENKIPKWVHADANNAIYAYFFNTAKAPTNDLNVRSALSMVIDREVIANKLVGAGEKPAYSILPNGIGNYFGMSEKASWAKLDYQQRVSLAKELLKKSGYSESHPLTIELSYNTNELNKKIAVAVASMWKKLLNVETKFINIEYKSYYTKLKEGDFQIGRVGTGFNDDPFDLLRRFRSSAVGGNNYARFENKELDKLLDDANKYTDLKKRAKTLRRAERIILDNSVVAVIYFYVQRDLVNPKLRGYIGNLPDSHRLRYVYFEK